MGDENHEKEEQQQSGFKVIDRRGFTPQGQSRREAQQEPPQSKAPPKEEGPSAASRKGDVSQESPRSDASEAIMDFSSFLLSLATTGMVHLGEIPEPTTGQRSENVDAARQMIDILSILKEKTKGNLSAEEAHLLDSLLYELRMKFLTKSKVI
ncbi:MAG: DUF1844 domain-containing protein [Acidobacteriota bacterium]